MEAKLTYRAFMAVIIHELKTREPQSFWLVTNEKEQSKMLAEADEFFDQWKRCELAMRAAREKRQS